MAERALPDILLERYLLGELPRAERSELERRLAADPEARARLEALRASNEALLREHPPEIMAHRLADRLRRERVEAGLRGERSASGAMSAKKAPLFGPWGRPAFAGALFLALLSVPVWQTWKPGPAIVVDEVSTTASRPEASPHAAPEPGAAASPEAPEPKATATRASGEGGNSRAHAAPAPAVAAAAEPSDTRSKGLGPALALFRRTERGAEALQPGAVVRAGDELRVGYRAGGYPYGAIFSVDGNGSVTRHWPASGDSAARLEAGEPLLPGAFRLDAAPDYERFFLVLSEKPFALRPVLESLHAGKVPTAEGLKAVRFDLLKDPKDGT